MFSIDVKITIGARNIKEAYQKLYREMGKIDRLDFYWESLDTWFDEGGDPIDQHTIDKTVLSVIDEEERDG